MALGEAGWGGHPGERWGKGVLSCRRDRAPALKVLDRRRGAGGEVMS